MKYQTHLFEKMPTIDFVSENNIWLGQLFEEQFASILQIASQKELILIIKPEKGEGEHE